MPHPLTCPACGHRFRPRGRTLAAVIGSYTSPAKAAAARANGCKGGRPKRRRPPQ